MQLPANYEEFIERAVAETRLMISLGLWELHDERLTGWLSQFTTEEGRFFAAAILHQLVIRSKEQFDACLRSMYRGCIKAHLFDGQEDGALARVLRARTSGGVSLVPVICESDPPTKSGPLVLRVLKKALRISDSSMDWPWIAVAKAEEGKVTTIIFVDDFLGTGTQFEKFYNRWEFYKLCGKIEMLYCPVAAHSNGVDHVRRRCGGVGVKCAELLGEQNGFFSEETWQAIGGGVVAAEDAKKWYLDFAFKNRIIPKSGVLGVGEQALTFGFYHSTPNNSLPLLWYSGRKWMPLLER